MEPQYHKKEVRSKDSTIVDEPWVDPEPTFVNPGNNEGKVGQEPHPPYMR